jgi:tetratricopeptide (TPR) repeat protein
LKLDGVRSEIFALQDRIVTAFLEVAGLAASSGEMARIEKPETLDLAAYELYARGRQIAYQMTPAALSEAIEHFRRALEVDAEYAQAYAGLGHAHLMRYIAATDRVDLETGLSDLEEAVRRDPELGEPYYWLTYGYSRANRFEEAVAAGRRAIELEPDNPMAHYFLGVAYWLQVVLQHRRESWPAALDRFRSAHELAPRFQAAVQLLGWAYLAWGRYEEARSFLERAAEIEESGRFELARFIGAPALLSRLALRTGELDASLGQAGLALERLRGGEDHVYAHAFTVLALCSRGDVHLRRQLPAEAVTAFRQAVDLAREHPRSLGMGWLLVRARIGQAKAFRQLYMRREESAQLAAVEELLAGREGFDFSGIWEGGDGEMAAELASYQATARRVEEALGWLRRAVEGGWCEARRVELDPDFESLRRERALEEILAPIAAASPFD